MWPFKQKKTCWYRIRITDKKRKGRYAEESGKTPLEESERIPFRDALIKKLLAESYMEWGPCEVHIRTTLSDNARDLNWEKIDVAV